MKAQQSQKIRIRRQILSCMDQLPRTTIQIQELMNRGGMVTSTSKVGNNLKYLEDKGYVSRTMDEGLKKFIWIKINLEEYDEEEIVDVMIHIPAKMNKELDRLAKLLDTAKNTVIREALGEQLGI